MKHLSIYVLATGKILYTVTVPDNEASLYGGSGLGVIEGTYDPDGYSVDGGGSAVSGDQGNDAGLPDPDGVFQRADANLTALAELTGTGYAKRTGAGTWILVSSAGGSGTVTSITAGTGLSGGTITESGTIGLNDTAVTPGSYSLASITVDAQGRITSAASGTAGTVTSITAGTGLSGGTITGTGTIALANTAVTPGSYTTANITVDAQGRITAASNGAGDYTRVGVYRNQWIGAGAMLPRATNGATPGTAEAASWDVNYDYFLFAQGSTKYIQFGWAMPNEWDGSAFKVKVYWIGQNSTSGSESVSWKVRCQGFGDGSWLDADMGSYTTISDAPGGADVVRITSAATVTPNAVVGAGDLVVFDIYRGSDTLAGDARLLGIMIQYKESTTEPAIW